MANCEELYKSKKLNIPEEMVDQFWRSPNPDGLDEMDAELKGDEEHSKLMLLLQNYLYEDQLNTEGIEKRHHDLLDREQKIMAEVGTNGLASNDLRDFLVRVFRLHYNRREKSGISEWTHYYLNYNLDLYEVKITEEGCEVLIDQINKLEEGLQRIQNDFSI